MSGAWRSAGKEIDRDGVIYTVDSCYALKQDAGLHADLLIGADSAARAGQWRRWRRSSSDANFCNDARGRDAGRSHTRAGCGDEGAQIDFLDARKMDISSTQIREQIQKGLPFERLVPQAVADYIHEHGLYGAKTGMELNR
ncbi:MAG: nicotinate-nicotinamide nucleotide adenylyltransferase [Christensenellales bacterium]